MRLTQLVGDDFPEIIGVQSMLPQFEEYRLEKLAGVFVRSQAAYSLKLICGLNHGAKGSIVLPERQLAFPCRSSPKFSFKLYITYFLHAFVKIWHHPSHG